ncbi:putative WD repeat-containing protein C2A9.03-like [Gossypium australe]|uniref:Putative WD repeat-containing protein C2A9.03-like n=1 Tax=Gossypium australe TaxID=47621 RepID=A0A5B6WIE8_9ROSI|nr:putative WD repeat-containing protein C2A9.03-like [Gossypium australe]
MPSYVKFMKDILAKKIWLGDYENITLTEGLSVVIQKKLPPKLKDLGSLMILCAIGSQTFGLMKDMKSSIEEQLVLELKLKQLTSHLKYVFMGDNQKLSVINPPYLLMSKKKNYYGFLENLRGKLDG